MSIDDEEFATLVSELSAYLAKRPNAADTFEGVLQWWIKKQRFEASANAVQLALDKLVSEGVLQKNHIVGGEIIYTNIRSKRE
jgi:Fe2+ or Zn2+ uptake regulation protein